ncbi:hypothetical protein V8G54_036808 [Vigna mungo]|uniref:Uncharacterized protein n=1 Tax=Vigna mungo TaxID=3915 RepID=A0AAQ3MHX4_VIGMU
MFKFPNYYPISEKKNDHSIGHNNQQFHNFIYYASNFPKTSPNFTLTVRIHRRGRIGSLHPPHARRSGSARLLPPPPAIRRPAAESNCRGRSSYNWRNGREDPWPAIATREQRRA